jgi:hypothetical protein
MSNNNPTQSQRRIKYGLNVAIAVIAAVAIVAIINVIAYKRLFKVRWDFTATRQYSLSPQTRKVLGDLKGQYQIVTLFADYADPELQARLGRTGDLIEEYGQQSAKVTVERINPTRNVARVEKFYGSLKERYASSLEPVQKAIDNGKQTLNALRDRAQAQLKILQPILEDKSFTETRLRDFCQSVQQTLLRYDRQFDELKKQVDQGTNSPLPDYAATLETLRTLIGDFDAKVFAVAVDRLEQVPSSNLPNNIKEGLLALAEQMRQTRKMLEPVLSDLRAASAPAEYTQLRNQLTAGDAVVVLGPKQVQVIALTDMFRTPSANEQRAMGDQQPEVSFLGEERLTGALVNLEMTRKPLVVFISTGQRPSIGMNGPYEAVAQRLRNMSFEVKEWNPSGRGNPMTGQMMPPGPPPEPADGQKVVWVVLPVQEDPQMMMMGGGGAGQQVAAHVQQRLDAGEATLFFVGISPQTMMGMPDPISELLRPWGISPMLDRLVLKEMTLPNRRKAPTTGHMMESWSTASPITEALGGMPGVFVQASPMELGSGGEQSKGAKTVAMVTLSGSDLWAERELRSDNPTPSAEERADKFVIAAAAEKGDQRLVAFSDPMFATDDYTTRSQLGPGTADLFGAQFPANAELFVNSVYWLAGMDQLIAASARTQDIRRIESIEDGRLIAIRWALLAGLPVICGLAGVGVWFVRRRGG